MNLGHECEGCWGKGETWSAIQAALKQSGKRRPTSGWPRTPDGNDEEALGGEAQVGCKTRPGKDQRPANHECRPEEDFRGTGSKVGATEESPSGKKTTPARHMSAATWKRLSQPAKQRWAERKNAAKTA
jgi:hypothetical protein